MDQKKSRNKPDVSAGHRDITVWTESADRRLSKNRVLNLIYFLFLEKYFQNKIQLNNLKLYF